MPEEHLFVLMIRLGVVASLADRLGLRRPDRPCGAGRNPKLLDCVATG